MSLFSCSSPDFLLISSIAYVKITPEGNYLLKSLGQALEDTLKSEGVKVEMNTLKGALKIQNAQNKYILDNDLTDLVGIKRPWQTINLVQRFSSFSNSLVDWIFWDNKENVFNGNALTFPDSPLIG